MPSLSIILDVDRRGFQALGGMSNARKGIEEGKVIHLGEEAQIEVGTLRHGMESGADSVSICFPLPDGRVVLAETSAKLFITAAQAITAWQDARHRENR